MPKKILLADDSLTIQKVVELTFSDSDYDLTCVSNGLRALEKVREDRPDLILADVVMPEKNGYEVCEAIKGDPATSRIPVILLTGTFEPFDRPRAERIGADAIVSKPFDSQQLLRQVEALLARAEVGTSAATVAMRIPEEISLGAGAPPGRGPEPEPFDAGFSPEDFTGSVRLPTGDPFEEEYGRGDVDSAIEAFEKAQGLPDTAVPAAPVVREAESTFEHEIEESSWLTEEPERHAGPERSHWMTPTMPPSPPFFEEPAVEPGRRGEEEPTAEIAPEAFGERPTEPFPSPPAEVHVEEISADAAHALFDVPPPEAPPAPSEVPSPPPAPAAPPHELEALAQTSSIPELAQMLSSVSGAAGLSEADIDRLAARVVEKLSDRIIREIAWEVIPDMAEIVIKQRIKELEAGLE
ncbi:MAG TPA: response regulator [Thermoanaerobaculia bacterium]|nr:response regulator [Thermoanaerobaculia bacterium]